MNEFSSDDLAVCLEWFDRDHEPGDYSRTVWNAAVRLLSCDDLDTDELNEDRPGFSDFLLDCEFRRREWLLAFGVMPDDDCVMSMHLM